MGLVGIKAEAHIVGGDAWCMASSPVHYECFFLDRSSCETQLTKNQKEKPLDQLPWQCAPYPIDFRNIPKSGESPVAPTSTSDAKKN